MSPQQPWAANRSTLADIARLYEGVHSQTILTQTDTRNGFFDNIIRLDYSGSQYTSPYTGNTSGPFNNGFLRELVRREAGLTKRGQVEDFLKGVVLYGKGGGGGPSSDEYGFSDSLFFELPVWENGSITPSYYVATWFIYKLRTPAGCPQDLSSTPACQPIWQPETNMLDTLKQEMFMIPVRRALATWPVKL